MPRRRPAGAAAGSSAEREVAGGEALLVRERAQLPQRPDRRRKPANSTTAFRTTSGSALSRSAARSRRPARRLDPTLAQRVEVVDLGAAAHLERRVGVDALESLAPDRAGRAEDGYPLHPESVGVSAAVGVLFAFLTRSSRVPYAGGTVLGHGPPAGGCSERRRRPVEPGSAGAAERVAAQGREKV